MLIKSPRNRPAALLLFAAALLLAPLPAAGQAGEPYTEHTLQLHEGAKPAGKIAGVAWIAGHWRGEAFGGTVEEVWSPPLGNSMMGMFKALKDDGQVSFYELLTIVEEEGSLVLRLKHFSAGLKGWEEKDDSVVFPLVLLTPDHAYFAGMTFVRRDDREIQIFLASRGKDGTVRELEFLYHRMDDEPLETRTTRSLEMQTDQKIDYVELPARDFDAVQSFYERAFKWSFTDYGPEYRAFSDGKIEGGFYKSELRSSRKDGAALVILYATDLERTKEAVVASGGTILEDIFSFPGGRRFHFTDPHGNELAVWSDRQSD